MNGTCGLLPDNRIAPQNVAAMLSSCRHDPVIEPVAELNTVSGTLRLHVVPEWEGAPLALFSEYTNVSNYRTTVELLKMYFSEIELASVNGSVPVTDIELFNLDGPKQAEWSVPVGTYTALYAGLGVPEDLNHTDPSTDWAMPATPDWIPAMLT